MQASASRPFRGNFGRLDNMATPINTSKILYGPANTQQTKNTENSLNVQKSVSYRRHRPLKGVYTTKGP